MGWIIIVGGSECLGVDVRFCYYIFKDFYVCFIILIG